MSTFKVAALMRVVQRLCGNLQVGISKARQLLGWVPPVSIDGGLHCMKRLFDLIAGACAALILLLPIVLVALALRLTSKGASPVLV